MFKKFFKERQEIMKVNSCPIQDYKRETDNKHKEIAVQMMMEEKEKVTREMVQKDKERQHKDEDKDHESKELS
jgi:hypothetical protein